jgi:hypothetical protein
VKSPQNEEKFINVEPANCGSCKEGRETSPAQNCHPLSTYLALVSASRAYQNIALSRSDSKFFAAWVTSCSLQHHEFSETFLMPAAASLELRHSPSKAQNTIAHPGHPFYGALGLKKDTCPLTHRHTCRGVAGRTKASLQIQRAKVHEIVVIS